MKYKKIGLMFILLILLASNATMGTSIQQNDDLDPLVDIMVTIDINTIRILEKTNFGLFPINKIDLISDPDFFVKIIVNNQEFVSETWENTKYLYDTPFSVTVDVPDEQEIVNITIQLWDANPSLDVLCDISNNWGTYDENLDVDLEYSVKTGSWSGDDFVNLDTGWYYPDESGYGRLNGCDDGSIYQSDRDCELWFDIYQNDYDGDGIPYWTEVNVYKTDPTINNLGEDADQDGIPIEWEHKWGHFMSENWHDGTIEHHWFYDPFIWDDHENLDPDEDGLNNIEEYKTSQWGSDPFRKDLFIELDQMEAGPDGQPASLMPENSKELLQTAYDKHNIVYHLDDGSWENSGSDMIPFDEETNMTWGGHNNELIQIYNDYFLHSDENNSRKGIFHYSVLVYQCSLANGNAFGNNRYQISYKGLDEKEKSLPWLDRDIVFASAYMHECGHTLGIMNPGVDVQDGKYPWQINWWRWLPYQSVMNYVYTFSIVDYSDGSRGMNDFDDWSELDLTYFGNMHW